MDTDRDGYVDQQEMEEGLANLFAPGQARAKTSIRVAPDILFAKMDSE